MHINRYTYVYTCTYVCYTGCLLFGGTPLSKTFSYFYVYLRNDIRVIQGRRIAPANQIICEIFSCCALSFQLSLRVELNDISFQEMILIANIIVLETLTNETGQMVVAFEKLGQFYDTCRDFKKKPVNFTPGKRFVHDSLFHE